MTIRQHGTSGPTVIVLHGGPGAPGYMAPVAEELATGFRVLEPFQRGSGDVPLTVARHVADLHDLVSHCESRPSLVGHSWGAMLALAYGAAHPEAAGSLALVACGSFDADSRRDLHATLDARMDDSLRRRIERLGVELPDPDRRLAALGDLLLPLYSHDVTASTLGMDRCDARAHDESWGDMIRQQDRGLYPAAFAVIDAPVLMLHGAADPHPGPRIRAGLAPHLPQLEYREWERCGHYPWLERAARREFFDTLRDWLGRRTGSR